MSYLLSIPLAFVLFVSVSTPQARNHFPTPPDPLDPQAPNKTQSKASRRVDYAQLQRDADELARTAQTIPSDVTDVRKGMLPKEVIEKLKQIEKLSKRLRTELNP